MTTAAVTTDIQTIELRSLPAVSPGPGDVVLRVETVGVCGTDLHIYDGSYPVAWPVVQGHEISGVVESAAPGGRLAVGDRVAVANVISCCTCVACRKGRTNTCERMDAYGVHRNGGLQQQLVLPEERCVPAGSLSPTATALSETVSVGLRAVTRPSVGSGDRVVVLGGGPIGLTAVIAARDLGAEVAVVELQESRRALASSLGAVRTIASLEEADDVVRDWTGGDLADVVLEATGSGIVAGRAFDLVGTAGRLSFVGVSAQEVTFNLRMITAKELDIFGSRATLDFEGAVALTQRREQDVLSLVSHRYSLAQTDEAIKHALAHPDEVVKAVIDIS